MTTTPRKRSEKPENGETMKKGPGADDKFTPQQVIDALTAARGMRTLAARSLGCAYNTIRRYIETYPEVAEAEQLAREVMLDAVELKLFDRCMKDDITAIIFMLKTQGKRRGYVEKQVNVNVDMSKLSDDELRTIAES